MMNRSISNARFSDFKADFKTLFERVEKERGELDLRLRNNYFNLYYKGNSLAKVSLTPLPRYYSVSILQRFAEHLVEKDSNGVTRCVDKRFQPPKPQGQYWCFGVPHDLLPSFFRTENLRKIYSSIAAATRSQEIAFEQMFITDNLKRDDFLVIDRQIEASFFAGRMDVLALVRVEPDKPQYRLAVLEFKLGNNPELEDKVGVQLDAYANILTAHFSDFKVGYEKTYQQMHEIGLLGSPNLPQIDIVGPVEAYVVVGGYSGLAQEALKKLRTKHPHLKIKEMFHRW